MAQTDPRDRYRAAYESLARDADDPPWLAAMRSRAIERFQAVGFPTLKDEAWRYTNVAPVAKTEFSHAPGDGVSADDVAGIAFPGYEGAQAVFVNGRLSPELSSIDHLPEDVRLSALSDALEEDPKFLEAHLGNHASVERNPFAALNAALFEDGAVLRIARRAVVEDPIHLLFVSRPGDGPAVTHPRNLIVLEEGSEATVIEDYAGWAPDVYLTNAVTEAVLNEDAKLDHYKVQRESEAGYHVATLQVHQDRMSRASDLSLSFGGALVRNDVNSWFADEGGELALNGLYVVGGTQHVDNHTQIDHAKPHCTSSELYKGVLNGRARGVFYGNVTVHPDAQKTNAIQTNKNLLLSEQALVDSIPGLKIFANDVKCKHGSTIGQLDKGQVFYLQSRGLDETTARSLLTYAFASELVRTIRVDAVRRALDDWVLSRLPNAEDVRQALGD